MKDYWNINYLVKKIAEGDSDAFSKFYDMYFQKVFLFSRYFIKSEYSCQEVVSDVFLSLWHNSRKLPEVENLPSYLYTITRNKAYDYLDKLSRIPEFTDELPLGFSSGDSNPEELVLHAELEKVIDTAVKELPERCKLVFLMAREGGLRYSDIARALSISEKTVQAQMITAMKKLGNALRNYFVIM
jgi:RNA polymerase sigma-70 factor (family 1)